MYLQTFIWTLALARTFVHGWEINSVNVTIVANPSGCSELQVHPDGEILLYLDSNLDLIALNLSSGTEATIHSQVNFFGLTSASKVVFSDRTAKEIKTRSLEPNFPETGTATPYPPGEKGLLGVAGTANIYYSLFLFDAGLDNYPKLVSTLEASDQNRIGDTFLDNSMNGFSMDASGWTYACGSGLLTKQKLQAFGTSLSQETIVGEKFDSSEVDGNSTNGRIRTLCSTSVESIIKTTPKFLYLSSEDGHTIRLVDLNEKTITTIAGVTDQPGHEIGFGADARFTAPKGIGAREVSEYEHEVYVCDSGNNEIKKIVVTFKIPEPTCDSRIVLALDRTFSNGVGDSMAQTQNFVSALVDSLEFGGVSMGLVNILPHTVKAILNVDDPGASDQTIWQQIALDLGSLGHGWKSRASQFWTLSTDIADSVAEVGKNSFIILVSDGRLRDSWRWRQHYDKKIAMKTKWGDDAPNIICVLVRKTTLTLFHKICNEILIEGKNGKTLAEQATNLVSSTICPVG